MDLIRTRYLSALSPDQTDQKFYEKSFFASYA